MRNHKWDILVPALLNSISNLPPVRFTISSLSAAMLAAFVTSRAKVSIPISSKLDRDPVDRAVAKTRMPWAANSSARAFPTPPREHLLEVMLNSPIHYIKKRQFKVISIQSYVPSDKDGAFW